MIPTPPGARALVIALACACSVGCGRKASPRPPEDVRPQTVTDLSGRNVQSGIRLSWSRPRSYTDGTRMPDLGGFLIERAVGADDAGAAFQRLAVLAVDDRERFRPSKRFRYVDEGTTPGTRYRYRVVSFTTDRYVSAPSNIAAVLREEVHEEPHALLPTPGG